MRSRHVAAIAAFRLVSFTFGTGTLAAQEPPDYILRQLSPSGEAASRVGGSWAIDPRGDWVAFVGDVEVAGAEAVYAMRRNGSDLHRLSPQGATGAIAQLAFSPDGRSVVYRGDLDVDGLGEVWSVAPWASAATAAKLNGAVTGAGVLYFRVPQAGNRLAYVDQLSDERFFPYSVPITGPSTSAVTLYQGVLATPGDALDLAFTPDSARVVFRMDLAVDQRFDLYWAPADGSAVQSRITNRGSNPAPARSVAFRWYVHPDGERVIYQFDEFSPVDERGIGEQRLVGPYTADARLNGVPVTGGKVSYFELFPDGKGLVYHADESADEKFELFAVDLRLLGDGFESGDSSGWIDPP